jgi:hypothetical protein
MTSADGGEYPVHHSPDTDNAVRQYSTSTLAEIAQATQAQIDRPDPCWQVEPVTLRAILAVVTAELYRRETAGA